MSGVNNVIDSSFIFQLPLLKQDLQFAWWNLWQPAQPGNTVSYNFLIWSGLICTVLNFTEKWINIGDIKYPFKRDSKANLSSHIGDILPVVQNYFYALGQNINKQKKVKRDYMYESIRKQVEIILLCECMKGTS